jgi:aprataxin
MLLVFISVFWARQLNHVSQNAALKEKDYEPMLKEDLSCFHCERMFKNIPTLKAHLQEEFDKLAKKAKDSSAMRDALERKRKREDVTESDEKDGAKKKALKSEDEP